MAWRKARAAGAEQVEAQTGRPKRDEWPEGPLVLSRNLLARSKGRFGCHARRYLARDTARRSAPEATPASAPRRPARLCTTAFRARNRQGKGRGTLGCASLRLDSSCHAASELSREIKLGRTMGLPPGFLDSSRRPTQALSSEHLTMNSTIPLDWSLYVSTASPTCSPYRPLSRNPVCRGRAGPTLGTRTSLWLFISYRSMFSNMQMEHCAPAEAAYVRLPPFSMSPLSLSQ